MPDGSSAEGLLRGVALHLVHGLSRARRRVVAGAREESYHEVMVARTTRRHVRERRTKPFTIHVLIVDDSPDTRAMYGRYFQFRGLSMASASDGADRG